MFFVGVAACTSTNKSDHGHKHDSEEIVLNDGAKWTVVPEMLGYIRNMEVDVSEFKGESLEDHHALADTLNVNLDLLTSNCTMSGKAHDELHKWLLPYIHQVEELAECTTAEDAGKTYLSIKEGFTTFNTYFQ
jgi:hypothetical protein